MEYIKIAILLCAGIYLNERFPPEFAVIFIISLIMVLTITAVFKHKFNVKILVMLLVFILGACMCRYAKSDAIRDLSEYTGHYITAEGRISEIPAEKDENVQYIVDVRSAEFNGEERKSRGKLLLTAKSGYRCGDSILFSGFIEELPKRMNENGFDFATYYKSKNIFFKVYSTKVLQSEHIYRDYSPYALANMVRSDISEIVGEHYKGDYSAIMKAVLTGNKKEFSDDFSKVLTRTGTGRFFYPAFLHMTLFMSLLAFVLSAFDKRKRDKITVFLLIIYAVVNLSSAVFVKLSIMTAVLIFFRYRYGRVYFFDVVGLTAIIMGLINPLIFFNAGFVMSVLSSILIYYFFDYVNDKLKFIRGKYVRRMLSIGIICTFGLIPLSAYFFNGVTLSQAVTGIVMIPCVAVILILSPLLIIMFKVFGAAPLISKAVSAMLFVLKHLPYTLDKMGINEIALPKPTILFLIIYLLIMVALVKYIKNKKKDMYAALFTAAALMVSGAAGQIMRLNDTEISFINVGQGDGALISAPYQYNILIDGGGGNAYSDYDPGEKVFLEYLLSEGITYIDSAFVSHYHQDHVQGIIAAMENIRVRNLFLPDNMEGNKWRVKLEEAARNNNTKVHYIKSETLLTYNNGMTLRIIPPAKKTAISDDENDTSYVCRIEYGDFSTVFTGDMSKFAENNLIETGRVGQSDVLKVSHHGSKTATGSEWLDTVKPLYAVISVGENNTYALPNKEVLDRLSDTELYRTDYDGDVRFTVNNKGKIRIDTFNRR